MKTKHIISTGLLLFAAGSVVYMFTQQQRPGNAEPVELEPAIAAAMQDGIVMYYFSQGKECSTCDKLESYSHETLHTYFKDDIEAQSMAWRKVDLDDPEHEHFVTDFDLFSKSIVLVEYRDGEQIRWNNLTEIWDRVFEKKGFLEYIRAETQGFKDASP